MYKKSIFYLFNICENDKIMDTKSCQAAVLTDTAVRVYLSSMAFNGWRQKIHPLNTCWDLSPWSNNHILTLSVLYRFCCIKSDHHACYVVIRVIIIYALSLLLHVHCLLWDVWWLTVVLCYILYSPARAERRQAVLSLHLTLHPYLSPHQTMISLLW